MYNLTAAAAGLAKGAVGGDDLPPGTLLGRNAWGRTGYGEPCPPIGRHRYFPKLYALDAGLPNLDRPAKSALLQALKGHVLEKTEWVGTYQAAR